MSEAEINDHECVGLVDGPKLYFLIMNRYSFLCLRLVKQGFTMKRVKVTTWRISELLQYTDIPLGQ